LTHADLAGALERVADDVAMLHGRGERFFVQRMKIERRVRELAHEAARLDPERRRRSFQTGMIVAHSPSKNGRPSGAARMIPVRVRRSRRVEEAFSRAFRV
jgi:hypothetical protein